MPIQFVRRHSAALFAILVTSALLCGCSKDNSQSPPDPFASAPAAVKQLWHTAADQQANRDYLGAANSLSEIFKQVQALTPEQKDSLQQAWTALGNRAFEAAQNGDKQAGEAVQKIRASPFAKTPGQR